jgi:hypothetical protein
MALFDPIETAQMISTNPGPSTRSMAPPAAFQETSHAERTTFPAPIASIPAEDAGDEVMKFLQEAIAARDFELAQLEEKRRQVVSETQSLTNSLRIRQATLRRERETEGGAGAS